MKFYIYIIVQIILTVVWAESLTHMSEWMLLIARQSDKNCRFILQHIFIIIIIIVMKKDCNVAPNRLSSKCVLWEFLSLNGFGVTCFTGNNIYHLFPVPRRKLYDYFSLLYMCIKSTNISNTSYSSH
jgi:hypothetical protein